MPAAQRVKHGTDRKPSQHGARRDKNSAPTKKVIHLKRHLDALPVDLFAGQTHQLKEDSIAYVVSGEVLALGMNDDGDIIIADLRGTGTLIGFERLKGETLLIFLRAVSDARFEIIPASEVNNAVDDGEDLAFLMKAFRNTLLAETTPRMTSTFGTVRRLAHFLLGLPDGISPLNLQKLDIANLLHMRPESLSRALSKLIRRGAVERDGSRIRILDRAALEAIVRQRERAR